MGRYWYTVLDTTGVSDGSRQPCAVDSIGPAPAATGEETRPGQGRHPADAAAVELLSHVERRHCGSSTIFLYRYCLASSPRRARERIRRADRLAVALDTASGTDERHRIHPRPRRPRVPTPRRWHQHMLLYDIHGPYLLVGASPRRLAAEHVARRQECAGFCSTASARLHAVVLPCGAGDSRCSLRTGAVAVATYVRTYQLMPCRAVRQSSLPGHPSTYSFG